MYFNTYIRNLLKNPFHSVINIVGLAIGIAGFVLIMLYVQFEFSYDKFNLNYQNIFRAEQNYGGSGQLVALLQPPAGSALAQDYPEVKKQTSFQALQPTTVLSSSDDVLINVQNGWLAQSSFFEVFDYKLIKGVYENILEEPFSIVLNESTASKLFGDEDPIDKIVKWDQRFSCKVTGIVEDSPVNSHISYNYFISYSSYSDSRLRGENFMNDWTTFGPLVYLVMDPDLDLNTFNAKIHDFFRTHIDSNYPSHLYIKPLSKLHFYSNVLGELGPRGDIKKVMILIAIAILILLIAMANFINLSTARAGKRSKEVGIKKVVGAFRPQLILQFLFEAFITIILALLFAITIIYLVLPEFSAMVGRDLELSQISYLYSALFLTSLVLLTTILSGLYPAFVISSFSPLSILKSSSNSGSGFAIKLRNALVVFQFSISIVLVISTAIIYKQTQFLKNTNLGFDKERILNTGFSVHDLSIMDKQMNLKAELLQNPEIENVSISNYVPGFNGRSFATFWEGSQQGESVHINQNFIDLNYLDMYSIKIVEGRPFVREDYNDTITYCLINETAKKRFNWDVSVGKTVGPGYKVVGVMKDFYFASVKEKILPLIYLPLIKNERIMGRAYSFSVQFQKGKGKEVMAFIEKKHSSFFPNDVCEFWNFDTNFMNSFRNEENILKTTAYFSILAVIIACMGLLGLTSFVVQTKNKEIGIRKVFGASSTIIIKQLLKIFSKWLLIANIIAFPVAYYFINNWLDTFPYRIKLGFIEFIFGAILIFVIAISSVIVQSFKASIKNPVETLKYE